PDDSSHAYWECGPRDLAREDFSHSREFAQRAPRAEAPLKDHLQWIRVRLAGGDEVGPARLEDEVGVRGFAGLGVSRAVVDHQMPGVSVGEAPLIGQAGAVCRLRVDDALDHVEVEA